MEDGIVHEENHIPTIELLVLSNVLQHLVNVLLKESSIVCTFDYLAAEKFVLSDSSNEGHRVHLLFDNTPLH